jgi:transcription-repair coupling factor (superfamily II helicase)
MTMGMLKPDSALPVACETWLNPGDFVVHLEHGVGRFEGLQRLNAASAGEGLAIVYADGTVLVPVADAHLIWRYGPASSGHRLDGSDGALKP